MGSDGSDLTLVTPTPVAGLEAYSFSPDSREVLFSSIQDGAASMSIARTDGSGVRALDVGMTVTEMDYRPPSGAEIVFVGSTGPSEATGLYAIRPDGTGLRTILEPTSYIMANPRWTSDGARVVYSAWEVDYNTGGSLARAYVVSADGQDNRVLLPMSGDGLNFAEVLSNDGTRVFLTGCDFPVGSDQCVDATAIVPIDGNSPVVEVEVNSAIIEADETTHLWAPSDDGILTIPLNAEGRISGQALLTDPATGSTRTAPWPGADEASWQRLAP